MIEQLEDKIFDASAAIFKAYDNDQISSFERYRLLRVAKEHFEELILEAEPAAYDAVERSEEEYKRRGVTLLKGRRLWDYSKVTFGGYQDLLRQEKEVKARKSEIEKALVANFDRANKFAMYDKETGEEAEMPVLKGYSKPAIKFSTK